MYAFLSDPQEREFAGAEPGDGLGPAAAVARWYKERLVGTAAGVIGFADDVRSGRLGRVHDAAVTFALNVENPTARGYALEQAYDQRIRAIEEAAGVRLENPTRGGYRREAEAMRGLSLFETTMGSADPNAGVDLFGTQEEIFAQRAAQLAESRPELRDVILPETDLREVARGFARAAQAELDAATGQTRSGVTDALGMLSGGVVGFVQDPVNVASLVVGSPASTATSVVLRVGTNAVRTGLIAALTTAAVQPAVQDWRAEAGLRSGLAPAAEATAFAFLIGGAFGLTASALGEAVRAGKVSLDELRRANAGAATLEEVQDIFGRAGVAVRDTDAPILDFYYRHATDDWALAMEIPDGVAPQVHRLTAADAVRHAENPDVHPPPSPPPLALPAPRRPRLADTPAEPPAARARRAPPRPEAEPPAARTSEPRPEPSRVGEPDPPPAPGRFDYDGLPAFRQSFDPSRLETDAATFQYKGDGDAAGVTQRLRSVRRWDPLAAGKVVVWERADGTRFVADGHQRSGLARRLREEDPERYGALEVDGYLFREADGWTPADVRAIAAKKNIQEGSGTLVDTARVLRDWPDLWDDSLPVSDERLTKARSLSLLSDEAWGAVVNGLVPPHYASHIAALSPDPAWHAALVRELVTANPPNEATARFVISDALSAGLLRETQETMFGLLETTSSLRAQRGRVFDQVRKALANEKRVFALLDDQAQRIEGAGNVLDRAGNQTRAQRAAELIQIVEKLATRAGPVSDALNRAAAAAGGGLSRAKAASVFLDDLRALIERDGLAGLTAEPRLATPRAAEPDAPPAAAASAARSAPADDAAPPGGRSAGDQVRMAFEAFGAGARQGGNDMLWDRLQSGRDASDYRPGGALDRTLRAARDARARGGLQSRSEFDTFVDDVRAALASANPEEAIGEAVERASRSIDAAADAAAKAADDAIAGGGDEAAAVDAGVAAADDALQDAGDAPAARPESEDLFELLSREELDVDDLARRAADDEGHADLVDACRL